MSSDELNIHEVNIKDNEVSIKGDARAVFLIAEQLGELLDENNVENYLTMELIPSITHTGIQKPIRVTVQWMARKSPEELLEKKIERIEELEAESSQLKEWLCSVAWLNCDCAELSNSAEHDPQKHEEYCEYRTITMNAHVPK